MKKLITILIIQSVALIFSGCDFMMVPKNYYVTIYNSESDKYITEVSYRGGHYFDDRWSGNMLYSDIIPYYDFRIIMEDDNYIYTFYENSVYVDSDLRIEACTGCYDKKTGVKVEKLLKLNKQKTSRTTSDAKPEKKNRF